MRFLEALEEIKKHYEIYQRVNDVAEIQVHEYFTVNDLFYLALIDFEGKAILSDIGVTADIFPRSEEKQWIALCKKHGLEWVNYHIEKEYDGLKSLESFLNLLREAAETMN